MKDSFYFPHDNNSFSDDKILAIRAEFGLEGYGLFWACVETMSRNNGYIMGGLLGGLSLGYGVAIDTLSKFLDFCVKIKLFEKDENGFYSDRMIEHLNQREMFRISGKKGAEKRWGNKGANGGANGRKGKERKIKERKEKKNKYGKEFMNVLLKEEEYKKLVKRFGEGSAKERIENLSTYIASKGDKYTSHYATILSWAKGEPKEKHEEKDYDLTKIKL